MAHGRGVDPGPARAPTLRDVAEQLRELRAHAGHPSFSEITRRIGLDRAARGLPAEDLRPARATVYDCFRTDRRRLDAALVVEIVRALGADEAECARWGRLCAAAQGRADAASVVAIRTSLDRPSVPFVGRRAELGTIDLTVRGKDGSVVWIEGMPGAGKTALATQAARALLDTGVVDETIVVDLRGFHADAPPADPAAVLEGLLRVLGVRARDVPTGTEARRALLAEQLAGRRVVLLLDDASGAAQVDAVLPPEAPTPVLVTSRVASDGAVTRVPVGPLDPGESIELLRAVAGDIVDADPAVATELVEMTGRLPLAVGLTASRVATRPAWTLADHLEPLRRRQDAHRLDDAVQAALALSYASLSGDARHVLRFIAVQPFAQVDAAAVAALVGREMPTALVELVRHHLVVEPRPGTYAVHALVRTFALDRSDDEDRPAARGEALDRLIDHYAAMVWATYWSLAATDGHWVRRPRIELDVPNLPEEAARDWLAEHDTDIFVLAQYAAERGRPEITTTISEGAAWWLSWYSRHIDARLLHSTAARVAQAGGDETGEAWARYDLARVLSQMNYLEETEAELRRLEALDAQTEDPGFAALVQNVYAQVDARLERYDEAIARLTRAAEIHRQTNNAQRLTAALGNLAILHQMRGDLDSARHFHENVVAEAVRSGDRRTRAIALGNLAGVHADLGDHEAAVVAARDGLTLSTELEFDRGVMVATLNLGCASYQLGRHDEAQESLTRAVELARRLGLRHEEATALINLGAVELARGDAADAREAYAQAHVLSDAMGDLAQAARCLVGVGDALAAAGEEAKARQSWLGAQELYARIEGPVPQDVQERLAVGVRRS